MNEEWIPPTHEFSIAANPHSNTPADDTLHLSELIMWKYRPDGTRDAKRAKLSEGHALFKQAQNALLASRSFEDMERRYPDLYDFWGMNAARRVPSVIDFLIETARHGYGTPSETARHILTTHGIWPPPPGHTKYKKFLDSLPTEADSIESAMIAYFHNRDIDEKQNNDTDYDHFMYFYKRVIIAEDEKATEFEDIVKSKLELFGRYGEDIIPQLLFSEKNSGSVSVTGSVVQPSQYLSHRDLLLKPETKKWLVKLHRNHIGITFFDEGLMGLFPILDESIFYSYLSAGKNNRKSTYSKEIHEQNRNKNESRYQHDDMLFKTMRRDRGKENGR